MDWSCHILVPLFLIRSRAAFAKGFGESDVAKHKAGIGAVAEAANRCAGAAIDVAGDQQPPGAPVATAGRGCDGRVRVERIIGAIAGQAAKCGCGKSALTIQPRGGLALRTFLANYTADRCVIFGRAGGEGETRCGGDHVCFQGVLL